MSDMEWAGGEPWAGEGLLAAFAPCFMCGVPFFFDPDTVLSILVDPVTGLSPELGGDPARAIRRPIDADCMAAAAAERRRRGLGPHRLPPGWALTDDGRIGRTG